MDDLFQQFRDHLERRPEPPFEERDWRDLEKRLRRQSGQRRLGLAGWWIFPPLVLLLLGSNWLSYREVCQVKKKLAALELQRAEGAPSRDTVWFKRVVHQTDTVYRTRVVVGSTTRDPASARLASRLPFFLRSDVFSPHSLFPIRDTTLKNPVSGTSDENTWTSIPPVTASAQGQWTKKGYWSEPEKISLPYPAGVSYPAPDLPVAFSDLPTVKARKTLGHYLYALRPTGVQAGISGGWAQPFSGGLQALGGFSTGLETAVEFSPRIQLWTEAAYVIIRFASSTMNADIGIPPVDPPTAEYRFLKAEAPQPSLQFALGARYVLPTKSRWKPFAGLGVGLVSLLPYEVVYDFREGDLGVEWTVEKKIQTQELLSGLLFLQTGVGYEVSDHWRGFLRASYRINLRNSGFQAPNLLGIQGGWRYRF